MRTLSIVIPAYNEERTLAALLDKVIDFSLPEDFQKEIIIVNDSSKDNTQKVIDEYTKKYKFIKSFTNEVNQGKTQSVKRGIANTTGDLVVIQDADLEYVPQEISALLEFMIKDNLDVVYGNRFGKKNQVIYLQNYIGNLLVSTVSNIFTFPRIKHWIVDMEVCYKLVDGNIFREIASTIESKSNFGFEPEITAKLARYKKNGKHLKFGTVAISYFPRSVAEGKKIKAIKDGSKAIKEIIKFNLF